MSTRRRAAAAVAAATLIGAGGGAGLYAGLSGGSGSTVTVVRPVATSPVAASSAGLSVNELYRRTKDGVVEILVTADGSRSLPFGGGGGSSSAEGSGFVVDAKGDVVTNAHVVGSASSIKVVFGDGSTYTATLVGADRATDVAVVRVDAPASELHPLSFGDSTAVAVGDGVVAIGAPFGLGQTVTSGIVSAVGREIQAPDGSPFEDTIQTDAAINHGNSGGPLFDLQGKVIGITSQIESDSGGSDGIGFAVASKTAQRVASQLIAAGKATHALLGVTVQTVPPSAARTLDTTAGVAVVTVKDGTGAAKAGLKPATGSKTVAGRSYPTGGDVITAIDGDAVATAERLRAVVDQHVPGDKLTLTVHRGTSSRTVEVTLGSR